MSPKTKNNLSKILSAVVTFVVVVLYLLFVGVDPLTPTDTNTTDPASPAVPSADVAGVSNTVDDFEIYFSTPTNHIENHLIEKINEADKSIHLAVFEFDLDNVKEALLSAHRRGVEVKIVYDNEHTEDDPQMKELIGAGISAVPDERSAFMHNKFFVFDGQCVWTGSFNITVNASTKNNENAFYMCDDRLSANYEQEFSEMFAGQFGPRSPSDTPYPQLQLLGNTAENYFASEDEVMTNIISAVSQAKSSVHFMAFSFTDDDLGKAMVALRNQGVEVSGIFESRGADTEASECSTLLKSGADIRLDGNKYTFHHKVIIIDQSTVIFGSFNFSANAGESNDENLLIIRNSDLAEAFEAEFNRRLSESRQLSGNTCD